ncbi:OLC1v1026482C2 [Oldenlandia corymbosa var. corymbosa]|uniref:OLC1v1026482C2 n=1 Tax=Oldenlandia corymbosa var. corymbosa TaxID=529605 RepID=A0AAV1C7K9_OLDCO|nr:OLC1v1026482C2 [Oldenlandia corymbosa var. corymbosa]
MATKRKKQNVHHKNSEDSGVVANGVKTSDRNSKRKITAQKKQQQLFMNEDDYRRRLQEVLYSPEYILEKIFREDGPALGDEFDSLPDNAFRYCNPGSRKSHRACQENQRAFKRQKISASLSYQPICEESYPANVRDSGEGGSSASGCKHGIGKGFMTANGLRRHGKGKGLMTKNNTPGMRHGAGKGLMTLWRLMNPEMRCPPASKGSFGSKRSVPERRKSLQRWQTLMKKRLLEKKKPSTKCRKKIRDMGGNDKFEKAKEPRKDKCELSLEWLGSQENIDQFAALVDDEELELRELQAGPNPLTCSAHFANNGLHGCSLCKDLLAKFPPHSVSMKLPLYSQPWDSSPELVKKLLKVFHFLCTYAVIINVTSFTFDEFAIAFEDQDSLLLGQVHVALLKVLLSDIEMELKSVYFSHACKNSKFVQLLRSVDEKMFLLELWQKALNAMTWTEIMRQVLVAAGFGSKLGTFSKEAKKEVSFMAKYGLTPGTLKGELFSTLLTQGNKGMKVSELAKIPSIVDLNLAAATHELELLISSTLSSDITLFEKISVSGYRLRVDPMAKEPRNSPSDSEDFGSVDDDLDLSDTSEDSECEMRSCSSFKLKQKKIRSSKENILASCTEIDESHPGEAWCLGLMEGEYSDLSIEEKLSALLALVDLLSSGSSCRIEDPVSAIATSVPKVGHGSGAKIKRSTGKQNCVPIQGGGYNALLLYHGDVNATSGHNPVDSRIPMSKNYDRENSSSWTNKERGASDDLHPMQSIYLGSDRRYNRYWLFLGPCSGRDPGHKRIYFESSDDGHWEVINNEEALCSLVSALDRRGVREAFLLSSLEKRELYLCQAMSNIVISSGIGQLTQSDQSDQNISREDSSSAVSDVDNSSSLVEMQSNAATSAAIACEKGRKTQQQKDKWARAQAFDRWIWKSFYFELKTVKHGKKSYVDSLTRCEHCRDLYWRDEKHCTICHTTFELDFDLEEKFAIHIATCREDLNIDQFPKHKVLSSQLQALKAALSSIELVIPDELMVGAWARSTHNLWVKRLRRASTLAECLQVRNPFIFQLKWVCHTEHQVFLIWFVHHGTSCNVPWSI